MQDTKNSLTDSNAVAIQSMMIHKKQLAEMLDISLKTINRKISDAPLDLPPYVNLGTVKRHRPVWIAETVMTWLKSKETATVVEVTAEQDLFKQRLAQAGKGMPVKRKPGRPKKMPGFFHDVESKKTKDRM